MDYLLDAFNARSGDIYSRSSHRIALSQHRLWHAPLNFTVARNFLHIPCFFSYIHSQSTQVNILHEYRTFEEASNPSEHIMIAHPSHEVNQD